MPDEERPRDQLHHAIMADDAERTAEVVGEDASLAGTKEYDSPLLTALYRGRRDSVQVLLAASPDLTADEAAAVGDVEALRRHLDATPSLVERYAHDGYTLLHRAAWFGHLEACRLLLDRGANVGAYSRDEVEHTPLHAAVRRREQAVAELLLQRGAPTEAPQIGGFTALHLAAFLGDEAMCVMLIEYGASAKTEADDGKTPADIAYLHEHDVLSAMLEVVAESGSSA